MEAIMEAIYSNIRNPAGLASIEKLYKEVKKRKKILPKKTLKNF